MPRQHAAGLLQHLLEAKSFMILGTYPPFKYLLYKQQIYPSDISTEQVNI